MTDAPPPPPCAGLSLLTPLHPRRRDHIAEAAESVQKLRETARQRHMAVEWVVVHDGSDPRSQDCFVHDAAPDVEVTLPAAVGIAACRNVALSRARGEWVFPLDGDDLIEPDGLLTAFESARDSSTPDVGWVATNRTLLNGDITSHWFSVPRIFEKSDLAANWTTPFVFHPNSVLMRRQLLLEVGGWPAIPSNEDMALLLRLSEESRGVALPAVALRYRVWEKQEVQLATYLGQKQAALYQMAAFINALRASRNRPPVEPPGPGAAFGIINGDAND